MSPEVASSGHKPRQSGWVCAPSIYHTSSFYIKKKQLYNTQPQCSRKNRNWWRLTNCHFQKWYLANPLFFPLKEPEIKLFSLLLSIQSFKCLADNWNMNPSMDQTKHDHKLQQAPVPPGWDLWIRQTKKVAGGITCKGDRLHRSMKEAMSNMSA